MTFAPQGLTLLSPCKLNLCLYVLGPRPDGFHNLQSVFTPLDFGDTMVVRPGTDAAAAFAQLSASNQQAAATARTYVTLDGAGQVVPPPQATPCVQTRESVTLVSTSALNFPLEHNLIYRAVKLLEATCQRLLTVTIGLDKRIPMGGGLGGGSSNAATTLLALNAIFELGLTTAQLAHLGAQLGSDAPFFVHGTSALVEGRGELITPLNLAPQSYLVVTPRCHVSTKEIFTAPELKRHYSAPRQPSEVVSQLYCNDLVPVVTEKFCEIGHTLDILVKYGHPAMSGTGASCFVACPDAATAQHWFEELTQHGSSLGLACGATVFWTRAVSPSLTIQALSQVKGESRVR